jgi:hypothetical protein
MEHTKTTRLVSISGGNEDNYNINLCPYCLENFLGDSSFEVLDINDEFSDKECDVNGECKYPPQSELTWEELGTNLSELIAKQNRG